MAENLIELGAARWRADILIVDDSATTSALLRGILSRAGHSIRIAGSGKDCIEVISKRRPDLILLDIMLPDFNGIELCRSLRKQHSKLDMPIVLVSSLEESDNLTGGIGAGANDYLMKPINREVLLARVQNQLDLIQMQNQIREIENSLLERSKLETVGLFTSGVAHNFNNLMTSIQGATEMLNRIVGDNERAKRCLKIIEQAIQGGSRLNRRMHSFALGEDMTRLLDTESLRALADAVTETQAALFGERVLFELDFEAGCPAPALIEAHFVDILTNLVSNAAEAIEDRGRIRIKIGRAKDEPGIMIKVTDSGRGMSEEIKRRLFEPFFSTKNVDHAHGVSTGGHGLGLWNVYHLVQLGQGKVWVESEPGKGTDIQIIFPIIVK